MINDFDISLYVLFCLHCYLSEYCSLSVLPNLYFYYTWFSFVKFTGLLDVLQYR
jgi:hypothetical protein